MVSIRIEGTKDNQLFVVEGSSAIRNFRTTEEKKSIKKKKWSYIPDNNQRGKAWSPKLETL